MTVFVFLSVFMCVYCEFFMFVWHFLCFLRVYVYFVFIDYECVCLSLYVLLRLFMNVYVFYISYSTHKICYLVF